MQIGFFLLVSMSVCVLFWQVSVGLWKECLEALEEAFLCPSAGKSSL